MTETVTLLPADVSVLRTIVGFSKVFSLETLKVTSTGIVGVDDTPSLAVFITPTSAQYTGPELFINRLAVFEKRLGSGNVQADLTVNKEGVPVAMVVTKGRSSVEFQLGSRQAKFPKAFTGSFVHSLDCSRDEFREILDGVKSVGGKQVTITNKNGSQVAIGDSIGEKFKYVIGSSDATGPEYTINYLLDHLTAVDKLLPPNARFVGQITPRGQMMVKVTTPEITADIFILDIKTR